MKQAVWFPTEEYKDKTRLYGWMKSLGYEDYEAFYNKSIEETGWFWGEAERAVGYQWMKPYTEVLDLENGTPFAQWYTEGTCNVVESALSRWLADEEIKQQPALMYEGENGTTKSFTYEELDSWVSRVANGLKHSGIEKGDRVTIYMPMIPETVVAMLAVMKIGAIISPIFSGFASDAVMTRVQAAGSKMIITADGFSRRGKIVSLKDEVDKACEHCPSVEKVVIVHHAGNDFTPHNYDLSWSILEKEKPFIHAEEMKSDDPLMLIYTSGTTGKPKGTVHTHTGFPLKAAFDAGFGMNIKQGDRVLWVTDMGWMMGPFLLFGSLINGATMVMYEGVPDYPEADRLWETVDRYQITHLGISPTLIRALMAKGDEYVKKHSLASLEVFASTGEPWNPDPWMWLFETVGKGKVPICNYSGGTEISGGIFGNVLVKPIAPISFNASLPGMAAVVLDEQGNPIRDEVGELCLEKPWVGMTKSFWGDDERYVNTYWSRFENKWVHGDWVIYDGEQYIITGRSDDTLNIAGKRIGPAEYESILVKHHDVIEAAAIGVPDEVKGEVCHCFIVLREGTIFTHELKIELLNLVNSHIGKALCPKDIHVVEDLPKTRNSKVMRRVIKAAYLGRELGDLSSLVNPEVVSYIQGLQSSQI
ncbi:AMP-dependent synthetase [Bacillus pseudomycoides]|uniref:AMP-binding protein n=1 Tax=Bacillus pseudomycoides TaxID=64104 RepID=UPI000BEB50C9|nr:AMP-binding protein [Bacillus pseudomycoides]PDY02286.1 AMP-dependent synthetase [Bacillus pseudomycoides]PEK78791.1 AMP-dependent synthetase [Bacillus pseudomycoides]PEN07221.1 AMP-dependent synthetase [Bacillus pseudomycoides]PGB79439.1 AMP-dependent synthetase [Bacillus pseudomycoides]PHE53737.1 AMP-dependent synthetase [Bacillus pseudomycoides]